MPLTTIFFDLGNVLLFFSREKMFEQIGTCTGLEPSQIEKLFEDHKITHHYELGKISSQDLYLLFKKHAKKTFSSTDLFRAASDIFTPNEPVWEIVRSLKKQGIRLILLSNTNECHFKRAYCNYPLLPLFDKTLLSYELGLMKPDPRIFHKALASAKCPKNQCFFTDDMPENVESARSAGLDSEIFTDAPSLKAHLQTRGLKFF